MALKPPASMADLVYMTNRGLGEQGKVVAWVRRQQCPKCKKGLMGKPIDPKTGRFKTRAAEYECPECKYLVAKDEYEPTLTAEITYTCPHCAKDGEQVMPFIRKKVRIENPATGKKKSIDSLRFKCSHCEGIIDVTKKMKS